MITIIPKKEKKRMKIKGFGRKTGWFEEEENPTCWYGETWKVSKTFDKMRLSGVKFIKIYSTKTFQLIYDQ